MYVEIFTSIQSYALKLGAGTYLRLRCDYASWLWSAYELINAEVEHCGDDELIIKYLNTYRRLRWERSVKLITDLKRELMKIRNELRRNCPDELICLANRLYEYDKAVNTLYGYYRRIHELDPEDLSKLSVALNRYNMPLLSLRVFDELMLSSNEELKYLTFLSLLNPVAWPLHITMDVKVMPYLNWVLIYVNEHFIALILSLNRTYVISDLNVNINGGRVTLSNDYEVRTIMPTHIATRIESLDGHGLIFIGNWSDYAVDFNVDFKPREGSVKGLSLDANLSQLVPMIVPPHDYVSIKYSV
ncbi:hypothetical protein [Vulcanisaeta sp. JCM 14467]|uniref:hypothetical protein n=1 Tax=Vulcanisaeta sp. JCM 14467 TaxID=1295370 RepID=UPI0006D29098|nr:hypothetical protein [Vulcanisaeta sp. JCM 14467]